MPDYEVKQGDCISSIAKQFGLLPDTIWNHPNNLALRSKRPDPNVLLPGDIVFVPDMVVRDDNRVTDQTHQFQLQGTTAKLQIRLMDSKGPRTKLKYILVIDGKSVSGQTNDAGWLIETIPPDAEEGKLSLNNETEKFLLKLGHLDPISTINGVQARLRNLGFYHGEINGVMENATTLAIGSFQKSNDLEVTGSADGPTQAALKSAYGS